MSASGKNQNSFFPPEDDDALGAARGCLWGVILGATGLVVLAGLAWVYEYFGFAWFLVSLLTLIAGKLFMDIQRLLAP